MDELLNKIKQLYAVTYPNIILALTSRAEAAEAALAQCAALADYPVTDDPVTAVRNLALRAEAAEAALTETQRERDEARTEVASLRERVAALQTAVDLVAGTVATVKTRP